VSRRSGRRRSSGGPERLKEIIPRAARVAVLWNPSNQAKIAEWNDSQEPARVVASTAVGAFRDRRKCATR
jgi:hypothetical protein